MWLIGVILSVTVNREVLMLLIYRDNKALFHILFSIVD